MVDAGELAAEVVHVRTAVPAGLAATARRLHAVGARLVVELHPPAGEGPEVDGWEIGAVAAAVAAGADEVRGVDPRRVARVRHIVERAR